MLFLLKNYVFTMIIIYNMSKERREMMENSIVLAGVIGPYLIIVGVGLWLNLKTCQNIIKSFEDNAGLIYLAGIITLLLGIIIVNIHNVWELSWALIITLIGWIALLKGAALLICPKKLIKATEVFHKNDAVLATHIIIIVVIGAFLTFFGFWGF